MDEGRASQRRFGWAAVGLLGVLLVGVGLIGVWVGRTLFAAPPALPAGRSFALVEVEAGSVARSLRLDVAAAWSGGSVVINPAAGTVTELRAADGKQVEAGDVIYTVDLMPVVIARGKVPVFRTMEQGDRGADVEQLQRLLRTVGVRSAAADGVFGSATAGQVKAWQKQLGQPQTGRVELGVVLFAGSLPAPLAWGEQMTVGSSVAPGAEVGTLLPASPEFTMVLPANQLALVDPGMAVTIQGPSSEWEAQLGAIAPPGEDGSAVAAVLPVDGKESICGEQCSELPATGSGGLPAQVTVVPEQEGPVVPTAALVVGADGSAAVVTEDGATVPVRVVASAGGRAVVAGVEVGTRIRVPGDAAATP